MGKNHKKLLNNLEKLRKSAGLTQQEMSIKAEVSRKIINAIENGVYVPSTVLALKISKTLNCHVEDIFELPLKNWGSPTSILGHAFKQAVQHFLSAVWFGDSHWLGSTQQDSLSVIELKRSNPIMGKPFFIFEGVKEDGSSSFRASLPLDGHHWAASHRPIW